MAKITLKTTYLNPQPVLIAAGTPQLITAAPGTETLYAHIQAPASNAGNVYIADSAANILAGNCTVLGPGEILDIGTDDTAADEDCVKLNLSDLFWDGANTGDKLVVAYLEFKTINYNG